MRGDEIAGGKDVADENPRLDFTLSDDVFSSGRPFNPGLDPGRADPSFTISIRPRRARP
jgi:hypothetical protein